MAAIARMIVVLSMLCAISGFALSYLKMSTASRIEEQVLAFVQKPALAQVFPDAENLPLLERRKFPLPDGRMVTVFPARKEGKLYGVALENRAPGFGGDLGVMVGFDTGRDALIGIGITEMKETPGIGTAVAEPLFTAQFAGAALPVELGNGVDALSGATVSSTGAVEAVKKAAEDYHALRDRILAELQ